MYSSGGSTNIDAYVLQPAEVVYYLGQEAIKEEVMNGQDVRKNGYRFSVINHCRDPIACQHAEATRIQLELSNGRNIDRYGNSRTVISLNRKHEYFTARKRATYDL